VIVSDSPCRYLPIRSSVKLFDRLVNDLTALSPESTDQNKYSFLSRSWTVTCELLKQVGMVNALTLYMNLTILKNTSQIQQKVSSLILSLALGLLLSANVQAEDMGMKLAKDRSLPGKNQIGECAVYADALFAKMNAAGVEAYRVSFDWTNYTSSPSSPSGAHAVVVFRDSRGRYYGVDNMTWKPIWLKGSSAQEWTSFIAGMDSSTSVRNTIASNAAKVGGNVGYAIR
jgi:hypothetical protein